MKDPGRRDTALERSRVFANIESVGGTMPSLFASEPENLEQRGSRILAYATMFVLALLVSTTSAYADDPLAKPASAEARERLVAGNRLYRLREFDKAVEQYKAGALKEDSPVFHYNLGQCFRQLGEYEDAIWHYERFLDRGRPTGEIKDAVDGFIKQMKDELAKKAMTQPPTDPAPDTRPTAQPPPAAVTVIDRAEPWYMDGVGWGLTGAGIIGVGGSIGLFISASGLDDDANAETQQQVRDELHERASNRRLIGAVIGIAGGAALVTGVIKLVIRPKDRERTIKTSLDVGFTGDGIVVMGTF